jgi:hypothetical protein
MRRNAAALTLGRLLAATTAAQPAAASAAHDKAPKPVATPTGYDVSYPQCATALPSRPKFGVVGVDGGRVLKPNPCLTKLITWARTATEPAPSYYVNTGNPGPRVSSYWPNGQQEPKVCADSYPANDSQECAYDYGWNAAADSFGRAAAAAATAGAPDPSTETWWLDVETGNSWESLQYGSSPTYLANDTAALQGMADQLRARGVSTVGAYSTTSQWTQITGGASLGSIPVWYAGVGTLAQAQSRCASAYSFTGGSVTLTQYASGGFDADWRC